MKKILSLLILGIFLITLVNAFSICVDKTPPSAPSNLAVSGKVGNIVLTWDEATDEPSCSGIDYYVISRNGGEIGEVDGTVLSFVDEEDLEEGSYSYTIYAVDKIGHNTGTSIKNDVVLSKPVDENGDTIVSGGGGRSSYDDDKDSLITITAIDGIQESGEEIGNGETTPTEPSEEGFFSTLTGAVVGGVTNFAKSGTGIATLIVLIGLLTTFIIVRRYRLRKQPTSSQSSETEEGMTE